MRGELAGRDKAERTVYGSSPHAWGARAQRRRLSIVSRFIPHAWGARIRAGAHRRQVRFIPTCVGNSATVPPRVYARAVHPHMRGELWSFGQADDLFDGSSPHAWGTHIDFRQQFPDLRFIPTCVGNSSGSSRPSAVGPVHPHMRGELVSYVTFLAWVIGSSPHAWGTRNNLKQMKTYCRFIPTCVGNSPRAWIRSPGFRFIPTCVGNSLRRATNRPCPSVHPHMRGELSWLPESARAYCGSSPHAWGTHRRQGLAASARRFIPTCVGNSSRIPTRPPAATVHPHMRGELASSSRSYSGVIGSSPHAWGTLRRRSSLALRFRFIPTCVGNSFTSPSSKPRRTVHPHMRGELPHPVPPVACGTGSSPHAWGTRTIGMADYRHLRFIPTCVGNSDYRHYSSNSFTVHPHMRGELGLVDFNRTSVRGSSPHAWGTLRAACAIAVLARFIPTCVGNSSACGPERVTRTVHPHMRGELSPN